jgi:hypothetical protein
MTPYQIISELGPEEFNVYEISTYGRSSVLAGQTRKVFLDSFRAYDDAAQAYPEAEPGYCHPNNTVAHLPGPDDYEPGGAWPDYFDDPFDY